jgi:hypothetical protein
MARFLCYDVYDIDLSHAGSDDLRALLMHTSPRCRRKGAGAGAVPVEGDAHGPPTPGNHRTEGDRRGESGGRKMVGPTFGGAFGEPLEMEGGRGIWKGMQNGGLFRGPAGDGFLHQTSKFWSRGPYGGPRWRCSYFTFVSLCYLFIYLFSTFFLFLFLYSF